MFDIRKFCDIEYRYPRIMRGKGIHDLLGIDTEAYYTGKPFMVCTSDGFEYDPRVIPGCFFPLYKGRHAVSYNLKYDSGALLYYMPNDTKIELWTYNRCLWGKYSVEYIPKKLLRFRNGRDIFNIWDIYQFYKMSLEKAAKVYLPGKKGKIKIKTKSFTYKYVRKHHKALKKYCVRDARLAADLGNFLLKKLQEFGIRCTALYSCASLSFRFFSDNKAFVHVWRYWKYHREAIRFAMEAYEGGKFEVTQRGNFPRCVEYDIVSAYPYQIRELRDISNSKIIHSKKSVPGAPYSFLRCRIDNSSGRHIPCGIMIKNVSVYPAGIFYKTITGIEYDYLKSINVPVTILDGYWLVSRTRHHPYLKVINALFKIKSRYKGNDTMLTNLAKIMMNSYYGKLIQVIESAPDRTTGQVAYKAGMGFNPFYAAYITAATRIQVTDAQNKLGDSCIGVHTDSVLCVGDFDTLDKKLKATGRLGCFERKHAGACLMVACGQYDIADKSAWKGIEPNTINYPDDIPVKDTWRDLLTRSGRAMSADYPQIQVDTWLGAIAKGHFGTINKFNSVIKKVDFNADTKRIWERKLTAAELLKGSYKSFPRMFPEPEVPESWKRPREFKK